MHFDYNKPLDLPVSHQKHFDIVIADPPHLSDSCFVSYGLTINTILKDRQQKVIFCTGVKMAELVRFFRNFERATLFEIEDFYIDLSKFYPNLILIVFRFNVSSNAVRQLLNRSMNANWAMISVASQTTVLTLLNGSMTERSRQLLFVVVENKTLLYLVAHCKSVFTQPIIISHFIHIFQC